MFFKIKTNAGFLSASFRLKVLAGLLVLSFSSVFAQQFNIRVYNVEDGLTQSQVTTILQDRDGYLWLGTVQGISRFDGFEFVNYSVDDGLAGNYITCGLRDRDGNLWFGHDNGKISIRDVRNHSFRKLSPPGFNKGGNFPIRSLFQDREGRIWIGTYENGVYLFANGAFRHFTVDSGLTDNRVYGIAQSRDGRLWFGTEKGIVILAPHQPFRSEFLDTLGVQNGLAAPGVYALTADSSDNIWAATDKGISVIPAAATGSQNRTITTFTPKDGLFKSPAYTLYCDREGQLWAGSREDGIARFIATGNGKLSGYFTRMTTENGLKRNKIFDIFEDAEGNYWFATNGGGICQFRDESLEIFTTQNGLLDNIIWSFCQDNSGNIWLGSDNGLTRLSGVVGERRNLQTKKFRTIGNIAIKNVFNIIQDHRRNLWFTSYGNGLFKINQNGKLLRFFTTARGLPANDLVSLTEDSSGNIWMATLRHGLIRYDPVHNAFRQFTRADGLSGMHINTVFCDRQGNLWIGTQYHGFMKYDGERFAVYDSTTGFPVTSVLSVTQDKSGKLWMATNEGYLLEFDGEKINNHSLKGFLSGKDIYSVTCDDQDNLWMGTIRGIIRYHPADSSFFLLQKAQGFTIPETNQDAILQDRDGGIWFGTIAGAIRYNPGRVKKNPHPPTVKLTKLRLFWDTIPLRQHAAFSSKKNYLTFFFSGISLTQPEAIRYRYKLEGFDRDWSPPVRENHVTYSNLPPGRYTFRVMARNNDGVWSRKAAVYSFLIRAPFWMQWWFISGSLLVLLMLAFSFHKFRVKDVERRNKLLEERVADRTRELVAQKEKLENAFQALLESEAKFRAYTETTSSAIIIIQDGRFRYVNPACETITGYSLGEILNLRIRDIVHPQDFYLVKQNDLIANPDSSESLRPVEMRIITKEGKLRIVDFTTRRINYEGKPAILGTGFDITQRKALEERLLLLSRAVETTPMAMVLTDLEGNIRYVNEGFFNQCGMKNHKNILGKPVAGLIEEKDRERFRQTILPGLRREGTWHGELLLCPPQGSPFTAEIFCSVIVNHKNQPQQFLIHFYNIEDRKQNERFLQESMESYRELFNSIPEAIYIQDHEGRFLDVNEGAIQMYGYRKEDFLGRTPAFLALPEKVDMEKTIGHLKKAFEGIPQRFEWVGVRKNGEAFPKEVLLTKSHYFGKEVALAIARDITERKRFEQMIQEEKERLAVTLHSIGDGVVATDAAGRIMLINPAAETLSGWPREEAIGKPVNEVFRLNGNGTSQNGDLIQRVIQADRTIRLSEEARLTARDGTVRMVAHYGAPQRDENGAIIGVVLVFRDITDRKQLEQERLKTQKLESVGLLAGGIAHDFNNILTAILGNISLAKLFAEENPKVSGRLSEAEKATLRAKDLTQQLLTFSKGGAPVKEAASITDIIQDSVSFTLSGSAVRCVTDFAEDLRTVEVDTGQISQVIQNLIVNAQQAMPEGGTIYVSARNAEVRGDQSLPLPDGSYVCIEIRDEGIGIAKEHLDKIFDPYFTTKKRGNGLGLATSFSIIKKHNGHIMVESTLGKGSTFTIYLPASDTVIQPAETSESETEKGSGHILLMDDEEMIREVAAQILQSLGYTVHQAADGQEAIEEYRRAMGNGHPYDAVIMDLTIPGGIGGEAAVRELLKIDPQANAIVASGYSSDPVMAYYAEYGFKGCVKKPFTVKELGDTLKTVLKN